MTVPEHTEAGPSAETILRAYGVWCSTAAETQARARVIARMGEFSADERETLIGEGWL